LKRDCSGLKCDRSSLKRDDSNLKRDRSGLKCDRSGTQTAKTILANWSDYLPQFWQVVPPSEKDSPEANPDVEVEKVLTPAQ